MKIAIVLGPFQSMPPEGMGAVEKVWSELAAAFAGKGHHVTLIGKGASRPRDSEGAGVDVVALDGSCASGVLPVDLAKDLAYAARVLPMIPPSDVVVTNTFWLPVVLAPFKRRKGRVVVHVARYPKGQMWLYRGADMLHAISSAVGAAIAVQAPKLKPKIRVLGYPVDVATFSPAPSPRQRPDVPVVLYAGRVHPEKGVHLLVDAFRKISEIVPRARLEILGPVSEHQGGGGPDYVESLRVMARGMEVHFLEPIANPKELAQAYRQADCFCYPSVAEYGEAFGLAVLEAMASGVPCVVSALECFRDFVRDGENALIFDHRAPDASARLAHGIISVLGDGACAERLSRAGRACAVRYATEPIADAYLEMFGSLLTVKTN